MTVSIIIPVYQISSYIERCINSVINQTYRDIECIIVDDATLDDSIRLCETLINNYHGPIRFKLLHHKVNRGLSASRNTGTIEATGEYVFYLDGDDELTPDCIEKLLRPVMKDPSIEMVMGNFQRKKDGIVLKASERKSLDIKENDFNSNGKIRDLYFANKLWQAAWNKLINLCFLRRNGLFFKEGLIWEDTLWLFYVMKYLNHLYTIPDITYHYMKHRFAITTGMYKSNELLHHWSLVYKNIAENFTDEDKGREARYHMRGFCYRCINGSDNKEFLQVAVMYSKILYDEKLFMDWCMLNMVAYISRWPKGKQIIYMLARKLIASQRIKLDSK